MRVFRIVVVDSWVVTFIGLYLGLGCMTVFSLFGVSEILIASLWFVVVGLDFAWLTFC